MKNWIFAILLTVVAPMTAVAGGVVWIDVRSPAEYKQDHLRGALLIPYNVIAKRIAKVVPNKHQVINLYCHSGRRAQIARRTLLQLGYTSVQNRGGIESLRAQGMK
ncbi:MAG: hypothetical protein CR974_02065 [Gammaproteobacteria bacterium]|nr:MAG: hypothetical protein CR974_02065 [Gammaproteobacteria bacterium]